MADLSVSTICRVQILACQKGLLEISRQRLKVNLAGSDIGELLLEETGDVRTRDLACAPKLNRLQHLTQAETGSLGGTDKPQPCDGLIVITTVPATRSHWFRQEALTLIEANRLTSDTCDGTEFSDKHPSNMT
ncbi:hypothetical protein GCM10011401_27920 [Nesterenkonia cremea]|uniref:Uncharacterized protein n=1 Tax=Nesterenkonia cremea TaxID=1882340 RepID=A0A917ERA4_9MICC|nr:hypothetical protein GCM10011401_27920 [Nesterenkonia cremea]